MNNTECSCGHRPDVHQQKNTYRDPAGRACECGCANWQGCTLCNCSNYRPRVAPATSDHIIPTTVSNNHIHTWSAWTPAEAGPTKWICDYCPATSDTYPLRCPDHHTHDVWMSVTGPRCAICGHPLDGTPVPPPSPPARTILGWQRLTHAYAVEKGFYEERPLNFGEQISLMHCELSEAMEEYRDGHGPTEIYEGFLKGKPEGIPIELADVVLRVLQYSHELGIDLEAAMVRKHAFNLTRPRKHGKRV